MTPDQIDFEPMTDEQIRSLAVKEWKDILSRLWIANTVEPTEDQFETYCHELGIVPIELLDKAITRCLRGRKYRNLPTIGEIWDCVRQELHIPDSGSVEAGIAEWIERRNSLFEQSMNRFVKVASAYTHCESTDDQPEPIAAPAEVAA